MTDGLDDYEAVADPLPEADEGDDKKVKPFIDPDLELCPVVPLGFEGGKLVFAMPEGEIRREPASKIGTMLKTDIFACQAGWSFLAFWRDGEDKFQAQMAATWFVRKCRQAGLWDSARPMRELGVWPAEDGALVLHVGDAILRMSAKGKPEVLSIFQALRERSGPLYRLRPPAPRPAKKPCPVDDGRWARDWLDGWNFAPIGTAGLTGADVIGGWLMAGLLGGFAPFRGHVLIHAMLGSGKTELMLFVHALQSALAGAIIDSFSAAGLKNDLAGNARPVLIDEAEAGGGDRGPGMVEQALEYFRRMATGDGGSRKQGDVGGGTVTQTYVGAAMIAGITPPRLNPADASRFVEVRLLPLAGALRTRRELEDAKAKAKALAPALLARALKGAWRYRADVDTVTAALVKGGETPRSADLVAMLIAGRRLLLHDEALNPDEAEAEVQAWRPLLEARAAAEVVHNEGLDALAHLFAADTGVHHQDRRLSLGQLVERWATHDGQYSDVVAQYGLRVEKGPGPDGRAGPWLLVANQHPRLGALFRGTNWTDWRRALGYLDDIGPDYRTWTTPNSIRFGLGVKQRALAIPLTPWIEMHSPSRPAPEPGRPSGAERSEPVPPDVPEEDVDLDQYFE